MSEHAHDHTEDPREQEQGSGGYPENTPAGTGGGSGRRRDGLVAIRRQKIGQDHLIDRIVLDNEDLLHDAKVLLEPIRRYGPTRPQPRADALIERPHTRDERIPGGTRDAEIIRAAADADAAAMVSHVARTARQDQKHGS